eukprot:CAMPEP_0179128654 /NCGR_PEP_ID=MMETSP0796-20121207/61009_1 /TAXON_ID=73915 /ORGANISM="Pyrodinium bahamense, Strain pbaha01" /LENGTH=55 /DNA_ID=CAMNT_0020827507 /DNA_START=1 /DNA_END=165 /DNA_ORIENTATION=+
MQAKAERAVQAVEALKQQLLAQEAGGSPGRSVANPSAPVVAPSTPVVPAAAVSSA